MFSHIDKELNELVQQLPETPEGYITPHQAEFLYSFVRLTQPKIVVETGFNAGHSACVILRAMDAYGGGALLSFDIARYDATRKGAEIVKARYESFSLIVGDTKQTLAGTMAQVLSSNNDATLDFAIVDGGHDVETARADMVILESLLRPGGYLWLDDFENANCINVGVNVVGREFASSRGHCLRFLTADNRGMMLHQKAF